MIKTITMVKDILATMERPPDLPPSRSADYCTKKSFFQVMTMMMMMMMMMMIMMMMMMMMMLYKIMV